MKRFSNLRSRILFLLLAVVLPVLFILVYSAYEQRQVSVKALKQELTADVMVLSGLMEQKVEGVRQLLIALSHEKAILQRDASSCNKFLTKLKVHYKEYVNFGATDPKGNIFCSAVPITKPINSSDLAWFRNAIRSKEIGIGDYQIGRITGKQILNIGYAARDESDRVQAVVYAPFYLDALNELLGKIKLKPEAVITILDRNGTILVQRPDHEKWVGKKISESELVKTIRTQHRGLIESKGVDGIRRIYSFALVTGTDNGIFIALGLPKDIALANIDRQFARNLILLGLIAVLSFGSALIIVNLAKHSEEKLRESEDKFKHVFETANVGKSITLPTGDIFVNKAFADLLGYSQKELNNKTWQELTPPDEVEAIQKILIPLLNGERDSARLNKRYLHKNGSYVYADVSIAIRRDRDGKPLHFITTIVDITERKRAEEALKESEWLLRETGRIAKVGGWEFDPVTLKGTWTDEVARIHDLDPEQETSVEIGLSFYCNESRNKIEKAVKEAIESGKSYDLELELVTAKGAHKWVKTIGQPVVENGKVVKVRGSFQDITERKQVELALRENEARLRNIFEQAGNGIFLISADNRYLDINKRGLEMLGYTREELLRMSVADVLVPRERPRLDIEPAEMMTGKPHLAEWEHLRKDGSTFPAEVSARRLDDQTYLAIVRDLTDHKKDEQALRESEKLYRSLFDNMLNGFAYCRMLFEDGKPKRTSSISLSMMPLSRRPG